MDNNSDTESKVLGRPSIYEERVKARLPQIKYWKQNGLTDKEIAAKTGVALRTLVKYKWEHQELREALMPPMPSEEEQAALEARIHLNHQKSFNSFMSFIPNRASEEERIKLFGKILECASLSTFPTFRKMLDKQEELEKKLMAETQEISDEGLPF